MKSFWRNIFTASKKENIYLDNAGATKVDAEVILAMREVEDLYANPSGIYRKGVEAKNKIEESRKVIANTLNCNIGEVIFTGSGTESINLALLGYVKNYYNNFSKIEKKYENKIQESDLKKDSPNKDNFVIPKVITTNIELRCLNVYLA
jgi:selenocysteine lyase/cysteine desulfurase